MDDNTLVKDIEAIVLKSMETQEIDGVPTVILNADQKVQDLTHLLDTPPRKKGHPKFTQAASFCRYVNEHKEESTRIYVPSNLELVAVINHHQADSTGAPGWGDHRATYAMKHSLEWETWTRQNKARMSQKEFAEFVEDNVSDIADRTNMVELIRTLQINSNVAFEGWEKDNQGNATLRFQKVVQARAGEKGEMELPPTFQINIPCFMGGRAMPMLAKLRFEVSEQDKKLKLWYELQQVERRLIEHTERVVADVEQATGIPPFYGTPA